MESHARRQSPQREQDSASRRDGRPAGETERSRQAGVRLLIVEDNADSADLFRELLVAFGHDCEVAYDGESAIELAHRFHPRVVLCDIGLPGKMNGYDVARAFREQDGLRETFLVAVTGYGGAEDVARAHAAGFDAHMTKPMDVAEVEELLTRAAATAD